MKGSRIVKFALFGMVVFGGVETAFADIIQYSFSTINVPGATHTYPSDINSSGQIVGSFSVGVAFYSFLDTGGSFSVIPSLTYGINDSGQIVGTFDDGKSFLNPAHSFLDSGGSFTTIDYPGANFVATQAHGMNDSGQIVGSLIDVSLQSHGFLYSGGSFTTIDFPGATQTFAWGINDSDQIVGYTADAFGGNRHGFLYSGGSFTQIDGPGDSGTMATGINNSGQIVGSSGEGGFVATPIAVPEPRSLPVLAGCLICLLAIACRRKHQ